MSVLTEIIAHKKIEVEEAKKRVPLDRIQSELNKTSNTRSLIENLKVDESFHFICEIKKASPSRGIIQPNFDPIGQANLYIDASASAISILTDEKYFMGNLEYLKQVRKQVNLPLLRKDFIVDTYQIFESRLNGADIILLIARVLTKDQIVEYTKIAKELGLEVLLEVADKDDVEKIPDQIENIFLGINNRDLNTFKVSIQNSLDLKSLLPTEIPVISESGIKTVKDCALLLQNGFKGALIGETLMRAESPKILLDEFRRGISDEK